MKGYLIFLLALFFMTIEPQSTSGIIILGVIIVSLLLASIKLQKNESITARK